jgi:hypothetical protein
MFSLPLTSLPYFHSSSSSSGMLQDCVAKLVVIVQLRPHLISAGLDKAPGIMCSSLSVAFQELSVRPGRN